MILSAFSFTRKVLRHEKEVAVKITETTDESVLLVECISCLS